MASAPEYAFGNYDPVPVIAKLAASYGIGCHSDACLGSYINPFIKELGFELECDVDFSVPGVTSISCDTHKYAYGNKGCSVVMFNNKKLRSYQFFSAMYWNGGMYATSGIAGSRPGCNSAGNWASMLAHGRSG